jgi:hypothetical protein
MNVTAEVPNLFPQQFVYQRIPIKDSVNQDDMRHRFEIGNTFIQVTLSYACNVNLFYSLPGSGVLYS